MRAVIRTNPHLRTYDKENCIYYTYNCSRKEIAYDLRELHRELSEMLDAITTNPLFISGWVDSMPNEQIK